VEDDVTFFERRCIVVLDISYNCELCCVVGLSADITSCITQAENCMSLLLSDNIFNLAADWARCDGDAGDSAVSTDVDSRDCEETDETDNVNEELVNCNSESQSVGHEMSADDRLADESVRLPADVVDTSDCAQQIFDDEQHEVNGHRQHGVHSFHYALHIDIASHIRVEQTEDNADVVRTLQELTTLLVNRYVPTVKRWLEVFFHNFHLSISSVYKFCIP